MSHWLIRLGILFLFKGAATVSPLHDLLPLDILFLTNRSEHPRFRVVPTEHGDTGLSFEDIVVTIIVSGFALICAGQVIKYRRK